MNRTWFTRLMSFQKVGGTFRMEIRHLNYLYFDLVFYNDVSFAKSLATSARLYSNMLVAQASETPCRVQDIRSCAWVSSSNLMTRKFSLIFILSVLFWNPLRTTIFFFFLDWNISSNHSSKNELSNNTSSCSTSDAHRSKPRIQPSDIS